MNKEKNARDYATQLHDLLQGRSVTFTQSFFKRYAREFKIAIEQDKTPHRLLERAIPYIGEHWDTQQLSVTRAVAGIQSREPVVQTVADRTAGYEELFELSAHQEAMMALADQKGWAYIIEAVRTSEAMEELKDYLEEKV